MHSKSLVRRYHTYTCYDNRLSFFTDAVSSQHIIFHFYSWAKIKHSFILEIKITFNIRNVLCEGNIFLLWSVGSEICVECAQHEETTCVLKSFLHFLPCVWHQPSPGDISESLKLHIWRGGISLPWFTSLWYRIGREFIVTYKSSRTVRYIWSTIPTN